MANLLSRIARVDIWLSRSKDSTAVFYGPPTRVPMEKAKPGAEKSR